MTNEELQQAITWFENRLSAAVMPGAREMFGIALSALREKQEREKEHIGEATEMIPKPVAPVVHGEWLNFNGDFSTAECDQCGELYEVSPDEKPCEDFFGAFKKFYKFCPNCGAKMEVKA